MSDSQDHRGQRKLLQQAIARIGLDAMPGRQLESTFKHEGNRHLFSELKHAEEDFILHAALRTDRFGNVTAGGRDAIPEGSMQRAEASMRAAVAAILMDDDEARRVVDAFVGLVRQSFRIADTDHRSQATADRSSALEVGSDRPPPLGAFRDRLASLFRKLRGEDNDGDEDEDEDTYEF
ncbi:hypothetical protein [Tautonia sociabilis]|uniref:Uncharacterized protein n=1 Tax=Tautonia sociabilis TaxID=2080755 RepID=A0A432MGB2_9BACT|nr:hypothetical protein [Tautonia sociabilis]RUL85603.1 hypothetical protein TsocGM_17990 [Tautonia sociabilis]